MELDTYNNQEGLGEIWKEAETNSILKGFEKLWNSYYFNIILKSLCKESEVRSTSLKEMIEKVLKGENSIHVYIEDFLESKIMIYIRDKTKFIEEDLNPEKYENTQLSEISEGYELNLLMDNVYRGLLDLFPEPGKIVVTKTYVKVEWNSDSKEI